MSFANAPRRASVLGWVAAIYFALTLVAAMLDQAIKGFAMYRSLVLTSTICMSLSSHPVLAQSKMQPVQLEDAAAFALLRGDAISSKIKSYCLNMQFLQAGASASGIFARPINDLETPKTREFLRDLEIVSAKGAALPAREMEEASFRGAGFSARAATYEECTNLPTVRLFRPMVDRTTAVVFALVIVKCGAITVGENFHLNRVVWGRRHLAHYYSVVSPPGCSQNSKVVPGKPTDKFFILER